MRGLGGPQVTVEDLAGELVTGDIIEVHMVSPCRELIVAGPPRRPPSGWWTSVPAHRPAAP